MKLPIFEKYIDWLIDKSTLDVPAWNIEKARGNGKSKATGWNYVDGCMILAMLEIYRATGEKKYYELFEELKERGIIRSAAMKINKEWIHHWKAEDVNSDWKCW